MNKKAAKAFAKRAGVRPLTVGDRIMSPLGQELFKQALIMPGQEAYALTLDGSPMAVVLLRRGTHSLLRYCDREGRIHEDGLMADTPEQIMGMALNRMSELVRMFLGERHPLAERVSANTLPA